MGAAMEHELRKVGTGPPSKRRIDGLFVFFFEARDQLSGRHDLAEAADPLPRAPDILPGLCLGVLAGNSGSETHLRGIRLRQVIRVHAGSHERWLEVIAVP